MNEHASRPKAHWERRRLAGEFAVAAAGNAPARRRRSQCQNLTLDYWSFGLGHSLVIGHWSLVIACCFLIGPLNARAADPAPPTIETMIGGWLFNAEHSYMAESQVQLPLLRLDPLS